MDCCGTNVKTNYCPGCGKVNDEPLRTLLAHIKYELMKKKQKTERLKKNRIEPEETDKVSYNKWLSWYDALRQIMAEKK